MPVKNELFRLSWEPERSRRGMGAVAGRFRGRLDRMKRQALREGWLKPQAVLRLLACPGGWRRPDTLQPIFTGKEASESPASPSRASLPGRTCAWRTTSRPSNRQDGPGRLAGGHRGPGSHGALRPACRPRATIPRRITPMAWRANRRSYRRVFAPPHPFRAPHPRGQGKRYSWGYRRFRSSRITASCSISCPPRASWA